MKRSYFLSRRLHHRAPTRSRSRVTSSQKRKGKGKTKRNHLTHRRRVKGGGIGETVDTMNGIPVSANALVTNSKGVTRSVKNREQWWERVETGELPGDNDV